MSKRLKKSFAISKQLDADLTYISQRLKVSRSVLLNELMSETLGEFASLLRELPEGEIKNYDYIRFYGKSKGVAEERIANLRQLFNDLLSNT